MIRAFLFIVLVLGFAGVFAGVAALPEWWERRALRKIPVVGLPEGSGPYADKLKDQFMQNQHAVRILERLRNDYVVSPMISPEDKSEIDRVIKRFYKEN